MEQLSLSSFQKKVLGVPEAFDVFLGGGRGGGKSFAMAVLALRHAEMYGRRARILFVRRSYRGLADFEATALDLYTRIYGRGVRFNAAEHTIRFPNGAYLELGQLEGPSDYSKFQGRSFTLLMIDEAQQYGTADLLDRLRSNLRGPADVPVRVVLAANPGGEGHHWLARRYVFRGAPWKPFLEESSGRQWVHAPSTFLDNFAIDQSQYRQSLESSCPSDPELLRAWLQGDWAIARGAYFGSCLEETRNAVAAWPWIPAGDWRDGAFLAHDFGSSAPSVTFVCVVSPGGEAHGKFYSRDSIIFVDELATADPNNLSKGLGWTVPTLADAITEMARRWRIRPRGVADDAIFSQTGASAGSIADEFRRCGVMFNPARKADRLGGWARLKRLMADAGAPDKPGLYVSRSCEYFWATAPYLSRDPRRIEDLDSRSADHAADAARYACLRGADKLLVKKVRV